MRVNKSYVNREAVPNVWSADWEGATTKLCDVWSIVAQAANIKDEAEALISQHESLLVDVERQKFEATTLLDRGYRQQQIADELLADVDAARDMARKAVAKAEDTLREANETLQTLRGEVARVLPFLHDLTTIYFLRSRIHSKALVNKTSYLNNSDFLIRLLYKYSY